MKGKPVFNITYLIYNTLCNRLEKYAEKGQGVEWKMKPI